MSVVQRNVVKHVESGWVPDIGRVEVERALYGRAVGCRFCQLASRIYEREAIVKVLRHQCEEEGGLVRRSNNQAVHV